MNVRRTCFFWTTALVVALHAPGVAAQAMFPSKPIRIVIPYPPGGAGDAVARAIGQRMSAALV